MPVEVPGDESGLKKIGEIFQDLVSSEAPLIVVLHDMAYSIDTRTLLGRLLKWNTKKVPLSEIGVRPDDNEKPWRRYQQQGEPGEGHR